MRIDPPEQPLKPRAHPDAEARLRAIMEEQGTTHTSNYETLLGAGEGLWDSDEELDAFLERIRAHRHLSED